MKKLLLFVLILFPLVASAHGLSTSQLQPWGDNLIEFEYDGPVNVAQDEFTIFYVYLLDQKKNPVELDNAYVKITKPNGSTALFGTYVQASDAKGSIKLGGILDQAGEYTAQVQVTKAGNTLGPVSYKFTVSPTFNSIEKKNPGSILKYVLAGLAGIMIGLFLGTKIRRNRQ